MSGLAKYFRFSTNLLKKDGTVPFSSLADKTVLLYFSASWCPPCRGFTPQLIDFYNAHSAAKKFETVLISWDEEKSDFEEYFAKMPWLALPFNDRKGMEFLTQEFKVESIPTLIAVNANDGKVLSSNCRTMVIKDPEGKRFPWVPQE